MSDYSHTISRVVEESRHAQDDDEGAKIAVLASCEAINELDSAIRDRDDLSALLDRITRLYGSIDASVPTSVNHVCDDINRAIAVKDREIYTLATWLMRSLDPA